MTVSVIVLFYSYSALFGVKCAGESSVEAESEADSNDVTERPRDDKAKPYLCTLCNKRFTTKRCLARHRELHREEKLYSCSQCEKRFPCESYLTKHSAYSESVSRQPK